MIILIIGFAMWFFLMYWLSKKEAHYNRIVENYKNLMNNDWKIEYMRNIENKEVDSEIKPKHRVCLRCMNRNHN